MTEPVTFPDTLYVEIRNSEGEPYFCATADVSEHAEVGAKIKVGTYRLVEIQEVEFQVITTKVAA